MAKLTGQVSRVRRQIADWCVSQFLVDTAGAKVPVTVAGSLCGLSRLAPGVRLTWLAEHKMHPRYGEQFVPYGWIPPTHLDHIRLFLRECVDGFESGTVVRLVVEAFGDQTLEVMTSSPDQVVALAKDEVTRDSLDRAILSWSNARSSNALSVFLHDFQVAPWLVKVISQHLGTQALELLRSNPYRLAGRVLGVDFSHVDKLAMSMGFTADDPKRLQGGVLWALRNMALLDGHTFLPKKVIPNYLDELVRQGVTPFSISERDLTEALQQLEEQKEVVVLKGDAVYLPDYYQYEYGAAKMLSQIASKTVPLDIDMGEFLKDYERGNKITLSEAQRDGLLQLAQHCVLVVTGLPGTGKTSLVRAVVQLFRRARIRFVLMAPTGIAAKRLASVTYTEAATIHRQFRCDSEGGGWGYNESFKYPVDAIVVDEVSMVDQKLLYHVLDAVGHDTRVVLVGDDAQLPSVGPGNVLRELLACDQVPHVRLTQIFRQAESSTIVQASHKIHRGELPDLTQAKTGEFRFIPIAREEEILGLVVQMAQRLKAKDANFQVLSPKYDGVVGVTSLNDALREVLNPEDSTKKVWGEGDLRVRQGDRVMIIQNNYKLGVYNGDLGKLVDIREGSLVVRIHGYRPTDPGTEVCISLEEAPSLIKLAYAVTVHKSQGSEFDTVILPLVRAHGRMLQRNLVYTAITRAKKQVWVLGHDLAFKAAVANDQVAFRHTSLGAAVMQASDALKALSDG